MLLSIVQRTITQKTKRDVKNPEDNLIEDALYEAMYYVAQVCEPEELTIFLEDIEDDSDIHVLRSLKDGAFIKVPEYPDFTYPERHLMMDESLTYAVIYLACSYIVSDESRRQTFEAKALESMALQKSNFSEETK